MDIKEIAQRLAQDYWKRDLRHIRYFDSVGFAEALIESYKAELLKEAGEPIYVEGTCEIQNWKWIRLAVDQANEYERWGWKIRKLYTSDKVAAAILKMTGPLEDQLAKAEQLWQIAQGRCDGLEEKLAKAEQRVAEACALQVATETKLHWLDAARVAKEIRSGEYRKFMKGE